MAARPQGTVVEVSVPDNAYLEMGDRRYSGPFRVTAESDGVAVVEVASLDAYLEGIREVPFSWHEDALAAQVVAARTYLAWTLLGGRSETGSRIGYDICATAACQVYAGVDAVLGEDGDRWREASAGPRVRSWFMRESRPGPSIRRPLVSAPGTSRTYGLVPSLRRIWSVSLRPVRTARS